MVQHNPSESVQSTRSRGVQGAESFKNEYGAEVRVPGADVGRGSTRASEEDDIADDNVLEELEREAEVQAVDADMEVFEGHEPVSESFSRPPTNNDPPEE